MNKILLLALVTTFSAHATSDVSYVCPANGLPVALEFTKVSKGETISYEDVTLKNYVETSKTDYIVTNFQSAINDRGVTFLTLESDNEEPVQMVMETTENNSESDLRIYFQNFVFDCSGE